MKHLTGLTILVTRPHPQGEMLSALIQKNGGNAIHLPTIDIVPLADSQLMQQIAKLDEYDWLIFVSAQAVLQIAPLIHTCWPLFPSHIKIAAVGGGTAAALEKMHLSVHFFPKDDWRSEGLLNELPSLTGKRIALIKGEGGRELLAKELIKKGAEVTSFITYQRCLPTLDMTFYQTLFREHRIDVVIAASQASLENLKMLIGEADWPALQRVTILINSPRLEALARQSGFKNLLLAKNASHHVIIETLALAKEQLCQLNRKNP